MSDDTTTTDLGLHAVEEAPRPAEDTPADFVTPDHTASADESLVERVKRQARERGGSRATREATKPTARKRAPKPPTPKVSNAVLARSLTDLYTSVGVMLMPFDATCGAVVMESADKCAASLVAVAETNDAVKRALIALTSTSAWGGVMIAHLPLLLVIAAHHGPEAQRERLRPLAVMMGGQAATGLLPDSDDTQVGAA